MIQTEKRPLVGVIMGSKSDLPTMKPASDVLSKFNVEHEVRIVSAHRTPEKMIQYGRMAVNRGLKVIIAGAGGSAHLPGMIASETRLPVLGVAVETSFDPLSSAFGSMLRMPKGKPLATLGKNETGAHNAGLDAIKILALYDKDLAVAYDLYQEELEREVDEADVALMSLGICEFMANEASKQNDIESGGYYF